MAALSQLKTIEHKEVFQPIVSTNVGYNLELPRVKNTSAGANACISQEVFHALPNDS